MQICPECGRGNRDEARFCDSCGTRLSGSPRPTVRKTVTVLFADISGFTALGESIDVESLRWLQDRYFDGVRGAIERHGGTVEKFIGDAVMAVFGVPRVREDDALRALRAALEIRASVESLAGELVGRHGSRIGVRIGVNTGEVVADPGAQAERLVAGDPVNVAARLEQLAQPGEIMLGEQTRRAVGDAVGVEAGAPAAVKGKAEPVQLWRLVSLRDPVLVGERREAPFVGREPELAILQRELDAATGSSSCRICTILGPAGAGKTRLAQEFLAEFGERAAVGVGRCLSYGEGVAHWPVAEIVSQLTGTSLPSLTEGADIAERIRAAIGGSAGSASSEGLNWAIRKLFEAQASDRPLVVVFEDLHWAEPSLLDLLEYLALFIRGHAVLLVCLARPELLDLRPSWMTASQESRLLSLEPLSASEATQLLEQLGPAPESVRSQVVSAAEGNPLFLEQMYALAAETGTGSPVVPPTIQALLAARIDVLEPGERAVLEAGSIEGRVFHRGAVAALLRDEERGSASARLLSLVRRDLIRPDESLLGDDDGLRFGHALIRDAVYEAIPKRRRAQLHERLAGWLDERREDAYPEIVGYHLEQACNYLNELGESEQRRRQLAIGGGTRLGAAGVGAHDRGDDDAASKLLSRAIALLPEEDPTRSELLAWLALALFHRGQLDEAARAAREASERSRATGARRAGALALLVETWLRFERDPSIPVEQLVASAEEARRVFEELGDERAVSLAWRQLGSFHAMRGDPGGVATAAFTRAVESARRSGDQHGEGQALRALAALLPVDATPVLEAIARCEELLSSLGASTASPAAADTSLALASLYAMRGRVVEARALCTEGKQTFEELGLRFGAAIASLSVGDVEMAAGDAVAAEQDLRRGYELLAEMEEKAFLSTVAAQLAQALYAQGRYEEAERVAKTAEQTAAPDDVTTQVPWRTALAKALARRGELERAETLAREAVAISSRTNFLSLRADATADLGEVLLLARRAGDAVPILTEALRLYREKGNEVGAAQAERVLASAKHAPLEAAAAGES